MNLKVVVQPLLVVLVIVMSVGCAHTQSVITNKNVSVKLKEKFVEARKLAFNQNFAEADKIVTKLISKNPNYIDALELKAQIMVELGNKEAAEANYLKAIELDPSYHPKNQYYLGVLYFWNDKFEEADKWLNSYLKFEKTERPRNIAMAKKYQSNAAFAKVAVLNPKTYDPKMLDDNVNSKHSEYLPSLTADGNTLYITRLLPKNGVIQEDFYVSQKDTTGNWTKAKPLGPPVNTDDNEGAQSISADGRTLVYTRCNHVEDRGACDLLIAEFVNGKWTTPKNMGGMINTENWESQPSLSSDGSTLYFVRGILHKKNSKDIWEVKRSKDGKWGVPKKLGAPINTDQDDIAPFIHVDNTTLYFVSSGHPGMGGRDLYLSRKEKGGWSKPMNLGYPINSKEQEAGIIVDGTGTQAYFASNKANEGKTGLDLYSFELDESVRPLAVNYLKGIVIDKETEEKLQADVELVDLTTGETVSLTKSRSDGTFFTPLVLGREYSFAVGKKGYIFYSQNFELTNPSTKQFPYELVIPLERLKTEVVGQKFILKNVFFDTGSAVLQPKSFVELDEMFEFLSTYPDVKVQINGHTDNIGDALENQILSQNRAKAVGVYLNKKGIENARMTFKGYGETMPIDDNSTSTGRANNRRTEVETR